MHRSSASVDEIEATLYPLVCLLLSVGTVLYMAKAYAVKIRMDEMLQRHSKLE
jgi:hypothetical protein